MGWEHLPARVQGWARGRDGPGACSAVWSHRARLPDGQMAHSESHANMSVLVLAALWQTPAGPLRGTLWRPGKDRKWDGPKKAAGQAKSRHTLAGPPPADRTRRQLCPLSPAHARALGEATHNPVHRHRPGFRVVFIFTDQSWQQGDTIPVGSGCRRPEELGPRARPRGPAGAHALPSGMRSREETQPCALAATAGLRRAA